MNSMTFKGNMMEQEIDWSNWIEKDNKKWDMLGNMTNEEQHQYWENKILNEGDMDEMHELDDI